LPELDNPAQQAGLLAVLGQGNEAQPSLAIESPEAELVSLEVGSADAAMALPPGIPSVSNGDYDAASAVES
jgi:hypothetical protein